MNHIPCKARKLSTFPLFQTSEQGSEKHENAVVIDSLVTELVLIFQVISF